MTAPVTAENRVKFDKTINLGHLISMAVFLFTLMVGWNKMDTRVVVLEEARSSQRDRDAAQDTASKENATIVKEALKDLQRSVERVADKVGAQK